MEWGGGGGNTQLRDSTYSPVPDVDVPVMLVTNGYHVLHGQTECLREHKR